VLQGIQAATLQRTLGWKEMGGLTTLSHTTEASVNRENCLLGSSAHCIIEQPHQMDPSTGTADGTGALICGDSMHVLR